MNNSALPLAERLLALEMAVGALRDQMAKTKRTAKEGGDHDEETGIERLTTALGNTRLAAILVRAGYTSIEAVQTAPDEALLAVDGVAERTLTLIRERLTPGVPTGQE